MLIQNRAGPIESESATASGILCRIGIGSYDQVVFPIRYEHIMK